MVVKAINLILVRGLNHFKFQKFLWEMQADFKTKRTSAMSYDIVDIKWSVCFVFFAYGKNRANKTLPGTRETLKTSSSCVQPTSQNVFLIDCISRNVSFVFEQDLTM